MIIFGLPLTYAYATLRQSVANLMFRNVSFNFAREGRKPGAFMNPQVIPTCIDFWPGEKELNLNIKHTTLEPYYHAEITATSGPVVVVSLRRIGARGALYVERRIGARGARYVTGYSIV